MMLLVGDAVHLMLIAGVVTDDCKVKDNFNTSIDSTQIAGVYGNNLEVELILNIRIYKHVGSLTYHNKL